MQIVLRMPLYERRDIMTDTNNTNVTVPETQDETKKSWSKKCLDFVKAHFVAIMEITVIVLGFVIALPYQIDSVRKDMENQYKLVEEKISSMNAKLDLQTENLEKSMDLNTDAVSSCNTRIDNYIYNSKSDQGMRVSFTEEISMDFFGAEYPVYTLSFINNPTWESTDFIAVDNNGNQYKAEELVGEKILVSYINNGQETCFYGQFNDQNQWDGNCIINVYQDDSLELIMDATYKDGILMNYEQIMVDHDKSRWIVSKRVSNGDVNTGETWTYIKEKDYEKLFDMDIVVSDDVMSVEYFKNHLTTPLEGYYNGNTQNGLYNDTSGKAYLIKYFENGLTKTIYQGNFVDGQFNDNTGNAWYIVKEEDTEYMYFKGIFADGNSQDGSFLNPISVQQIEEILENTNIDLNKVVLPENT